MRNCEKDYILNMTLQYLAYSDDNITDNPYHRAFDQTRRVASIPLANPFSSKMTIPPGGSSTIFNGVVPNTLDGTSILSLTNINSATSLYRLQQTAGTAAGFRTPRAPTGIVSYATYTDILDTPNITYTAVQPGPIGNAITLNYPANFAKAVDTLDTPNITFTANKGGVVGNLISLVFNGVQATATVAGSPPVVFTAVAAGTIGNYITLTFDGVSPVDYIVGTWNAKNPYNQVTYSGLASVVLAAQVVVLANGSGNTVGSVVNAWNAGVAYATYNDVTDGVVYTAAQIGQQGNNISLTYNGTSNVATVVAAWNAANVYNQVNFTGPGSAVPSAGTITLTGGIGGPSNSVSYTGSYNVVPIAQTITLSGGDGLTVAEVVGAWNTANPTNTVTYTGLGTVVPVPQTVVLTAPASTTVTINNNSVAVFNFAGATLTGVVVGDIMRISGYATNDVGPFAFNSLNSGLWSVINVSGTQVSVVRLVGQQFVGAAESVAPGPNDVMFYSAAGVQAGYKFALTGTFSQVSQRTFVVSDATPQWIDFVSTTPLPDQSGLTYVPGTMVIYSESKIFVAIEVDQDAVVQFNADTSNNVVINPIKPGTKDLVGSFMKWGNAYACVVVNTSINPLNVKFWTGE